MMEFGGSRRCRCAMQRCPTGNVDDGYQPGTQGGKVRLYKWFALSDGSNLLPIAAVRETCLTCQGEAMQQGISMQWERLMQGHTQTRTHTHSLTDRSNLGEGRVAIEYYC